MKTIDAALWNVRLYSAADGLRSLLVSRIFKIEVEIFDIVDSPQE
jgi:hypothetical protein